MHYLTNEEELRDAVFLVLFNMKKTGKGRDKKDLDIVMKQHEFHPATRIMYYEFDFKGYNNSASQAFTWLYESLSSS